MIGLIFGGPRWLKLVLAALAFGLAYFWYSTGEQRNVDRAAALEAGRPALVEIAQFDPARDVAVASEVFVRAQVDLQHSFSIVKDNASETELAIIAPLYASDAVQGAAPVGFLLISRPSRAEKIFDLTVAEGSIGPVAEINGVFKRKSRHDRLIGEGFAASNLVVPEAPIIVEPFLNGREAGLRPQTANHMFAILAAVFGGFQLLVWLMRPIQQRRLAEYEAERARARAENEARQAKAREAGADRAPDDGS